MYNQQFESRTDEMYSIQYFVIKFVSILWQVDVFFPGISVSSKNKTDRHDIAEILFNVALNSTMPSNEKKNTHARTYVRTHTLKLALNIITISSYPNNATLFVNFRVLTKHCNKYINL